ncbi:MAG: glycosyltransferase [Chloroflexi bacterium]|nr:glycosyltransferase [Chloroflexota bacterium]
MGSRTLSGPLRVSAIVPTCNRPELLAEALASIRALEARQDVEPAVALEILVADNGTLRPATQGSTEAVARAFGARYLRVEGAGASRARNAGLRAATGDFIAFLDDDDLWLADHLRPHLRLLATHPEMRAVVGQALLTDTARRPYGLMPASLPTNGDLFAAFLLEYHPQIGTTVARTSVRDSVGLFDPSLLGSQDWDWQLRLALRHPVGFVPVPCLLFRQREAGTADALKWQRLGYQLRVLARNAARAGQRRPPSMRIAREAIRQLGRYESEFSLSAAHAAYQGQTDAAWRAARWAVASSPLHAARDLTRSSPLRTALLSLIGVREARRDWLERQAS